MNKELIAAFRTALEAVATADELTTIVDTLPEAYREELADAITAQKTRLNVGQVNLDELTAAEIADLLTRRPELKDALSTLLITDEEDKCTCGEKSDSECKVHCKNDDADEKEKEEEEEKEEKETPSDTDKDDDDESEEEEEKKKEEEKDDEDEDEDGDEEDKDKEDEDDEDEGEDKEKKDSLDVEAFFADDFNPFAIEDHGAVFTTLRTYTAELRVADEANRNTLATIAERFGVEVTDEMSTSDLVAAIDEKTSRGLSHNKTSIESRPLSAEDAIRTIYYGGTAEATA